MVHLYCGRLVSHGSSTTHLPTYLVCLFRLVLAGLCSLVAAVGMGGGGAPVWGGVFPRVRLLHVCIPNKWGIPSDGWFGRWVVRNEEENKHEDTDNLPRQANTVRITVHHSSGCSCGDSVVAAMGIRLAAARDKKRRQIGPPVSFAIRDRSETTAGWARRCVCVYMDHDGRCCWYYSVLQDLRKSNTVVLEVRFPPPVTVNAFHVRNLGRVVAKRERLTLGRCNPSNATRRTRKCYGSRPPGVLYSICEAMFHEWTARAKTSFSFRTRNSGWA